MSQLTNYDVAEKGNVFNTAVTADTNIFATSFTATYKPFSEFVIYAAFQAAGKLKVIRTKSGTSVTELLNSDTDLTANAAYAFSVPVSTGETINIQYSASTTCSKLTVWEERDV